MSESQPHARSIVAAMAVVVIWSTSFSFAKEAIGHLGPLLFRFYSVGVGVLPMLPFVRGSVADVRRLDPAHRRRLLTAVTLTGTVVASINMLALEYFPASSVLAMMYTMPAFASVIDVFRRRSGTWKRMAAPAVALLGVCVYAGSTAMGAGALLMLFNALLWAVGTSLSGQAGPALKPLTAVTLQMLIACVASLPLLLIDVAFFDQDFPRPTLADGVGILYTGLLNGALVFWLWYYAIRGLGALRASYFTLFVPILGGLFAAVFFAEVLGSRELLGIALISLSMVIQRIGSR